MSDWSIDEKVVTNLRAEVERLTERAEKAEAALRESDRVMDEVLEDQRKLEAALAAATGHSSMFVLDALDRAAKAEALVKELKEALEAALVILDNRNASPWWAETVAKARAALARTKL